MTEKRTLFEAYLTDGDQFHIEVDIPEGVEVNITKAKFIQLLHALTEVQFFCCFMERRALLDVMSGAGLETDDLKGGIH